MSIRNISKLIQKTLYLEPVSIQKFIPFRYFGTRANPSFDNKDSDVNRKIIDNENSILYEKNLHPSKSFSFESWSQRGMEDFIQVSSRSSKQNDRSRLDINQELQENENEILYERILEPSKSFSSESQSQRGMEDQQSSRTRKSVKKDSKELQSKMKSK